MTFPRPTFSPDATFSYPSPPDADVPFSFVSSHRERPSAPPDYEQYDGTDPRGGVQSREYPPSTPEGGSPNMGSPETPPRDHHAAKPPHPPASAPPAGRRADHVCGASCSNQRMRDDYSSLLRRVSALSVAAGRSLLIRSHRLVQHYSSACEGAIDALREDYAQVVWKIELELGGHEIPGTRTDRTHAGVMACIADCHHRERQALLVAFRRLPIERQLNAFHAFGIGLGRAGYREEPAWYRPMRRYAIRKFIKWHSQTLVLDLLWAGSGGWSHEPGKALASATLTLELYQQLTDEECKGIVFAIP